MRIERNSGLIFALDNLEKVEKIATDVGEFIDATKISYPVVLQEGASILRLIKELTGKPVIADFKVADIPYTNARIVRQVLKQGAEAVIIHGFVGQDSVQECQKEAKDLADIIMVVEMSHPGALEFIQPVSDELARMALRLGVDGVIAPATRPERVTAIRRIVGDGVAILTPGVKAQGARPGDSIRAGADFEIVGRGIHESEDPPASAKEICKELKRAIDETKRID